MESNTVYQFVYKLITGYIVPSDVNLPYGEYIVAGLSLLVTVGVLWTFVLRPFYVLIRYHLMGGRKKSVIKTSKKTIDE